MAFDQSTRNRLARFVSDARRILTDEFTRQCKQDYGIDPDTGEVSDIARLTHLDDTQRATARILRETLDHYVAGSPSGGKKTSIDRIIREQAFTTLNRLCAVRMAEARGIVIESVGKGLQSKGFALYARVSGSALGETADTYRCYLFSVFDEIALDLPPLFDRFSPQGRLFPAEAALTALLNEINHDDLAAVWSEDETIGWLYQYFNTQDERREMRESAAPRNSRELAVRNQFFTPRYVVEFLVDNTLGRIWKDFVGPRAFEDGVCHFMADPPADAHDQPQDRRPKDPRDITMLDPACGSMHFGLYAFDVFERIYESAWNIESSDGADALARSQGLRPLTSAYSSKAEFLRDVPRLIIERNIHGVDIDPRAVQVAGLSLWLRAQRSWHNQGVRAGDRPQVRRSNLVCAEPMPGDASLLESFLAELRNGHLTSLMEKRLGSSQVNGSRATPEMANALCDLIRTVWQAMALAGEAGSLLQVDSLLATSIAVARAEWENGASLFRDHTTGGHSAADVADTNVAADFWMHAESLVLAALEDYARRAADQQLVRRQLFSHDTAQGFAFIDLMRHRFDVVLMNPPFGEPTVKSRPYLAESLPDSKTDIGMAFVTRFTMRLCDGGRLGAITNRVFVGNDSLEEWRTRYLLGEKSTLAVLLDLGFGVLDDALVEAAAYVVERRRAPQRVIRFIRVLDERDKGGAVEDLLLRHECRSRTLVFDRAADSFHAVPGSVLAYQLPPGLVRRIANGESLVALGGRAVQGLIPSDDFRFVRLAWEVPQQEIGRGKAWVYYAKGGEYNPFWDDIHLVVNWKRDGAEIRNFFDDNGKLRSRPQNIGYFGRIGATYPERTTSDFCPRVLPQGCIFSAKGQTVFSGDDSRRTLLTYIVAAQSRAFKMIVDAFVGSGDASVPGSAAIDYRSGLVQSLPAPLWNSSANAGDASARCCTLAASTQVRDETTRLFSGLIETRETVETLMRRQARTTMSVAKEILELHRDVEWRVCEDLGFADVDRRLVETIIGPHPLDYSTSLSEGEVRDLAHLWTLSESELMAAAVSRHSARRQLTKKSFVANRRLELVAHTLQRSAATVADATVRLGVTEPGAIAQLADRIVSFAVGCAFGRWDVRRAVLPEDRGVPPDLFAELPPRAPASLEDGAAPTDYPLSIPSAGVLVDDPASRWDVAAAVRQVVGVIWGDGAAEVESEICHALTVGDIRGYLRARDGFFGKHLSRYSQSRRKAPIYWPVSTESGAYTVWLYYHALTDQTLFGVINDHLDPKIVQVSSEVAALRARTSRSSVDERRLSESWELETELRELRSELLEIASRWRPNLNDGVMITASPLWRFCRHKPWQKVLRETWAALEAGDYDWTHLAYSLWPDRVREKCKHDKSLAIAHGLEELYQEPPAAAGKKRGRKPKVADPELMEDAE